MGFCSAVSITLCKLKAFFGQNEVQTNSADLALSENSLNISPLLSNFSAFAQDDCRVTQRNLA